MSTAVSGHSGAGPLSLMSCVRESSPPQDAGADYEPEKNVSTKKKFWNPRKWFKRKSNKVVEEAPNSLTETTNQTLRSRSTSELSVAEEQTRRRSGTPMHPGLSVSHDSVFHSPHSGSELELEAAQSSSSLSISHQPTQPDIRLQTELIERLRQRRGDTSEDDEGLPRSPCNSPTTTEGHLDKSHHKDLPTKSHSTCSDGSLLSMGSSEMDEDSFDAQGQSRHPSKLSLQDKSKDVPDADITEWGPTNSSFPLNHAAAHHKVSIRPKRTHGAPRRKRAPAVLPTTPEVNEDSSIRSMTPDGARETLTELYTSMSYQQASHQQSHAFADNKLKCSSLPPGLAGPGAMDGKLTRSRSNAGTQQGESFAEEEEYSDQKSKEPSFFGRLFPRRSGKKKKMKEEQEFVAQAKQEVIGAAIGASANYTYTAKVTESAAYEPVTYEAFDQSVIKVDSNLAIRPNALRSGPASRQRVLPIDIPGTPDFGQRRDYIEDLNHSPPTDDAEWYQKPPSMGTNVNAGVTEASSPTKSSPPKSPPLMFSMSPPKSPWSEKRASKKTSKFVEHTTTTATTESKSIVRIAGLSPLQQRVISLNDDTDAGFKSLTNFPSDFEEKPIKPVAKSHSFKSTSTAKPSVPDLKKSGFKSLEEKSIFKSLSLDSIKNADGAESAASDGDHASLRVESDEDEAPHNEHVPLLQSQAENTNDITITGPSHKAIVNIPANESAPKDVDKVVTTKEMSVTKVQLNREASATSPISAVVTKTEYKVTPSKISTSPKISRQSVDLELNLEPVISVRKFSNDNIEVIKKEDLVEKAEKKEAKEVATTPTKTNSIVTVTSMTNASHYRKNESIKRDAKPIIRTKSNSFDSVESKSSTPKSSQSSLDKLDVISNSKSQENIKIASDSVVRRRSLVKQRQDEEPELMKVFARRSLKLKDSDCELLQQEVAKHMERSEKVSDANADNGKSRDSDKENLSDSSPVEERKKPTIAPKSAALLESKMKIDGLDVTMRKPIVNKIQAFQNRPVTVAPTNKPSTVLKANALPARPKTEKFLNLTPTITAEERKDIEINNSNLINTAEIISNISEKPDLIQDSANVDFRSRKAEWEKRAQEGIRKTTP